MNIPSIDLASLPGLETSVGLFGSLREMVGYDDTIVDIMVYIYDIAPPSSII